MALYPVDVFPEAESDLERAALFYEQQQSGLGKMVLESLFEDIERLAEKAGIHPVYMGLHRTLAHRFPYIIYYRLRDGRVSVVAVLDGRQASETTRDVLTQR